MLYTNVYIYGTSVLVKHAFHPASHVFRFSLIPFIWRDFILLFFRVRRCVFMFHMYKYLRVNHDFQVRICL